MYLHKLLFLRIIVFFGTVGLVNAQQLNKCIDSIVDADNYKIRSVNVGLRYGEIILPKKGTPYTTTLRSQLLQKVFDVLKADTALDNVAGSTLYQIIGKISLSSANPNSSNPINGAIIIQSSLDCVKIVEPEICEKEVGQAKCLDINLKPRTLRFSPNNPAETLLSAIPRSSSPTILSNVPKPLLFLNPNIGFDYDKKFGLSQSLEVSTNLLDLNEILQGKSIEVKSLRLDVKASEKKSLNNSFYDSNVGVSISKFLPSRFFENISGIAKFSSAKMPNGDAVFFKNAVSLDGSILVKPNIPLINSIFFQGGYARTNNRFTSNNFLLSTRTKENDFHFRVLVNGQIKRDILRVGLWTDGGQTANSVFSYKRFAGLVGYAKDIGKGNQTFGLETMFGVGKVFGKIPNYAYFYGTNELKNFIYETNDSSVIEKTPAGPLIRSFGNGQAINKSNNLLNGSNSYWHFNLNLSVPIAKWSSPLIPSESLDLPDETTNLRDLIKSQAASGEVILGALYKKQGVTNPSEKAKREFKSINSAIGFLTDHANLYSIKPLFMFDAASFNGLNERNKTRFAMGGGLQVNVVIAKFEAGYVRTLNPIVGDSQGNFIMRLYFQNLF